MTTFVSKLEPTVLWRHFDRILTIPRGSKKEERARTDVIDVASGHGLEHRVDRTGNLVVRVPGTAGLEEAPVTVLQGHLDMVQEKNSDVDHDFDSDPIKPRREGEYLYATGTTLGADNGIGLAAMLALMEPGGPPHGPLDLLFTVDEETGLTGASRLDASMLRGRRLINMDSEEEGVLTVGCAGGADSTLTLPLESAAADGGGEALAAKLHGLKGGHSGVDIHLQRGNAVQLLARALHAVSLERPLRLAAFTGGSAHNAIPREAFAKVVVPAGSRAAIAAELEKQAAAIADEYRPAEPDLKLSLSEEEPVAESWSEATTRTVLRLLTGLPHGVQAMSYDIPGLVETSTNLATVGNGDGKLEICMSSRSSVASALQALRQKIRATATLAGAEVAEGGGYPGWKPNLDSELLAVVERVHERVVGAEPRVEAVHAGLECGIIGEMVPGMDMISFGPQIEFPHSPDERVQVASVGRFWNLLTAVLEELARPASC